MSYKPTEQMANNAKRGLKMRDESTPSNKGGTEVGLARARQFSNRESVSLETVMRTYQFLSRARVYYKPGQNTKGTQAYLMWGGPAGLTWANKILREEGVI
jgi:hypothetical protein